MFLKGFPVTDGWSPNDISILKSHFDCFCLPWNDMAINPRLGDYGYYWEREHAEIEYSDNCRRFKVISDLFVHQSAEAAFSSLQPIQIKDW